MHISSIAKVNVDYALKLLNMSDKVNQVAFTFTFHAQNFNSGGGGSSIHESIHRTIHWIICRIIWPDNSFLVDFQWCQTSSYGTEEYLEKQYLDVLFFETVEKSLGMARNNTSTNVRVRSAFFSVLEMP